eukprot:s873_g14.t2
MAAAEQRAKVLNWKSSLVAPFGAPVHIKKKAFDKAGPLRREHGLESKWLVGKYVGLSTIVHKGHLVYVEESEEEKEKFLHTLHVRPDLVDPGVPTDIMVADSPPRLKRRIAEKRPMEEVEMKAVTKSSLEWKEYAKKRSADLLDSWDQEEAFKIVAQLASMGFFESKKFGVYRHGGTVGWLSGLVEFPELSKVLARIVLEINPEAAFTSVMVSYNAPRAMHKDFNNDYQTQNYVVPIQCPDHGGELCVELKSGDVVQGAIEQRDMGGKRLYGQLYELQPGICISFGPQRYHEVSDWNGERTVLIAYTPDCLGKLSQEDLEGLHEHGFPIPLSQLPEYHGDLRAKEDLPQVRTAVVDENLLEHDSDWTMYLDLEPGLVKIADTTTPAQEVKGVEVAIDRLLPGTESRRRWFNNPRAQRLPMKFVFTIKPSGNAVENDPSTWYKRKARLVICGNMATEGDTSLYTETAPAEVVRTPLGRSEKDPVVIAQPPRLLETMGPCDRFETWGLVRALYGLREAPTLWGGYRDDVLQALPLPRGLKWQQGRAITAWWTRRGTNGEVCAIVVVYVDDFMICGPYNLVIEIGEVIQTVWETSELTFLGPQSAIRFLGMELQRSTENDPVIQLTQQGYVTELLRLHQVKKTQLDKVPITKELTVYPEKPQACDPEKIREAQQITGEVLWMAQRTRPDLSYTTSIMASLRTKCPEQTIAIGAKVLGYLQRTMDYGLMINWSDKGLTMFCDAAYAPQSAHSHSGWLVTYGGVRIVWRSSRQTMITLSTAESELLSILDGAVATKGVEAILSDIGEVVEDRELASDSTSALSISSGSSSWRTRHLRIKAGPMEMLLGIWGIPDRSKPRVSTCSTKTSARVLVALICCLLMVSSKAARQEDQPSGPLQALQVDWDTVNILMALLMILGGLCVWEMFKWFMVEVVSDYVPGSGQRKIRRLRKLQVATSEAIEKEINRLREMAEDGTDGRRAPTTPRSKSTARDEGANPMLKSLHGLENLNTATDSSAQGRSVSITGNAQLCSLDALGSLRGDVPHRIRLELSTVPMANLSLQGLLGLTRICSSNTCTSDSLRIFATNAGGEISEFLCLPESDRSLLQDMMPPSTPLLNATFNGCTSCARDCGYLPSGYRIACDYSVGLCGCPLGTGGPNCSLPSPEECMRPRLVEGNTKICEVCIQVQTNNYDTALLDPPQTVRVVPADSTLAFEWPQRISWQTPTEGQLCVDMTLPASDPPTGVETFELMLTYSDRTQDFFLPGSLREPLLYSVGPMYPWCLDSGDCFRSGNDTTSFVLTVTEPPTGSAEFQTQEIQVTEGAADVAVVVFRGGGDYGTLTSIIGVDENSSTAVPGLQYTWADEIISWPHGDSTPKAFTMSFPDDDAAGMIMSIWGVYQPPRNLTLTFVTQDSIRMVSTTLVINDDGDAGMLGFSSQRYETLEGSAGSGCLLYARREGGSSGRAAAKVEVVPCDSGEASATENDDYILAAGSLTWEDEVTGEQCAVTLSDIAQASGGTVAGPARLVLFQDAETEGDESICFGLTKLPDSVSEVTAADRSTFSSRSALVLQDEGPSGGPPQDNCVRGRPCTVDLSQSDLVRFVADRVWSGRRLSSGGEVTVALALRSCATCAAPTAATAPMLLSRNYTAQWPEVTVDPGRYLMCLCPCSTGACFGRPVASLTLDGMRGGQQATCFLGQPCELANVQGVGLGAGDALTAAESCGETELLSGLPGSRVASDITNSGIYSFDSAGILSSSSGVFSLCWCRGGATACTDKEDFQQQVGLFKASGPQQGSRVQCMLNSTCVLPGLTGTGLQSGDKLMALESCGSAASVEWGAEFPVATTLDGANYSFGHLSVSSGSVLRELDLCWCPAGAQCQSPPDFRVLAGKLQLLCPRGFFWPTDEGVPEREGKCQACMSYQTTIQVGAIGDAACVCQTDLAFQEVTDGNCGCRDGYHWSGATRSCEPCNSGQSCQWENLFQYSLGLPPLVPGFWSTPEGSVYRCFSDRTCPNTNSVCAYGRAGKACSLCAPGYVGGHDGECTPYSESCAHSNSDANLAAFIPLAALVALTAAGCCLIAVAMRGRSANKQTYVSSTYLSAWKTSLAQNFQYLQLLSIVSLFEVRWPTVLAEIWRLIRSITMDLVTLPSLGCLMEVPSAFGEMLVRFLVPVVLASLTFVAWGLLLLLRKSLRFAPGKFAESLQELITVSGAQVLELLMLVGTLFFSVLVRNGFILFTCARGPNQVSTVVIYPHIDCPSIFALGDLELWFELMPYALAYNVVFSFGLIFGVWYSARKTVQFLVQNDFAERGSWAFLSWEFRDTYTWWLLVKMSRDLLLPG